MRVILATLIFASTLGNAEAVDIALRGSGAATCAEFARDYQKNPEAAESSYFTWAIGFISGLNFAQSGNQPIYNLGAMTILQQQSHIRNYCDRHPLARYLQAVLSLVSALQTLEPPQSK